MTDEEIQKMFDEVRFKQVGLDNVQLRTVMQILGIHMILGRLLQKNGAPRAEVDAWMQATPEIGWDEGKYTNALMAVLKHLK
jgi:hypothetical protein